MSGSIKPTARPDISEFELRFVVIPHALASFLHTASWVLLLEYAILFVLRSPGFDTALIACTLFALGWAASKMGSGYIGMYLIRQRVWRWGRDRFETWDELRSWFISKSPQEIETLLLADQAKKAAAAQLAKHL